MQADILSGDPSRRALGMPHRLLGDERLAEAVGAGDERAFAMLFQRHHQQLYRYCRWLTGNDQDGQDALQSALTKALVALRAGRRNAPLRPWLYRIAHNESVSIIRARDGAAEPLSDQESPRGLIEDVEERERFALLMADLRELPEQQRGALVMRELSGLSHEEIAAALQLSVGAAKQSILAARQSLMEFAEGRAMTCDEIQRILSDDDRRSLRSRRVRAHMRDCGACSAFAQAIPRRRAELRALCPALPAAGAAGLLAKISGAGAGHGSGGAGLVAGGAAKGVGTAVSIKAAAAAGAAVVATATVGAVAVLHHATPAKPLSAPGVSVASGHVVPASHGALNKLVRAAALGYRPGRGSAPAASAAIHAPGKPRHENSHGGRRAGLHTTTVVNSGTHGNSALAPGHSHAAPAAGRLHAGQSVGTKSPAAAGTHARVTFHHSVKPKPHRRVTVKPKKRVKRGTHAKTTSSAGGKTSTTAATTTTIDTVTSTTSGGHGGGTALGGGRLAHKQIASTS